MLRRSQKQSDVRNNKAQSILEYSMILGLGAMVLYTMGPLFQRSIQGMIKVTADQIGRQENSDQQFDEGYLNSSLTTASSSTYKGYTERLGVVAYTYQDRAEAGTNALINMGYQEGSLQ